MKKKVVNFFSEFRKEVPCVEVREVEYSVNDVTGSQIQKFIDNGFWNISDLFNRIIKQGFVFSEDNFIFLEDKLVFTTMATRPHVFGDSIISSKDYFRVHSNHFDISDIEIATSCRVPLHHVIWIFGSDGKSMSWHAGMRDEAENIKLSNILGDKLRDSYNMLSKFGREVRFSVAIGHEGVQGGPNNSQSVNTAHLHVFVPGTPDKIKHIDLNSWYKYRYLSPYFVLVDELSSDFAYIISEAFGRFSDKFELDIISNKKIFDYVKFRVYFENSLSFASLASAVILLEKKFSLLWGEDLDGSIYKFISDKVRMIVQTAGIKKHIPRVPNFSVVCYPDKSGTGIKSIEISPSKHGPAERQGFIIEIL